METQSSSIERLPQTDKYAVVGASIHSALSCCASSATAKHPVSVEPKNEAHVLFADLGGTQLLVEEGRWYTCNRLQVG